MGLWLGTGLLPAPLPSPWGWWHLAFPVSGPIDLGPVPGPGGFLIVPGTIPASPPGPYALYLQALIQHELTLPCTLSVK